MKRFLFICLLFSMFVSCRSINFVNSEISMKESCVVIIPDGVANGVLNEDFEYSKISPFFGKTNFILPAGIHTFTHFSTGWVPTDNMQRRARDAGLSYYAELKEFRAASETFEFEAGKRYMLERRGSVIDIIELDNRGISKNGTMIVFRHISVANFLGWQYRNGINIGEIGPQVGLSIVNDPIVMHINGEAAIGVGAYGIGMPGNFSAGFSYRYGGSLYTFIRKARFGIGLGGGFVGHILTIPIGDEDENRNYKGNPLLSIYPQVPYLQLKGFLGEYEGFGIYLDYYPTVSPMGIGSFGFGLTGTF